MPRALRSTVKGLAQKLLGHADVRGFVRTRQLWLSKRIYRQPVQIAELRQRMINLGVTRGRTVWVQSSWNEFFNVAMRPSEVVELLRELIGVEGTLAMPAFPIDPIPPRSFSSTARRPIPGCCARYFAAPRACCAAFISPRRCARSARMPSS
jgi:aminoglycoside 3-N-acetyltransferase